jgi:hypothetical protein
VTIFGMRAALVIAAALLLVGCGTTKARPEARQGDSETVTLRPAAANGRWVKLFLSPDQKMWLGQWLGECEVQTAYFIPAEGGKPRPVTGEAADESVALGWVGRKARILIPRAACGAQFRTPGIYLIDPDGGRATLLRRVKSRFGGA